jgi:outer membrane murein-binding lipoprotein Lpp
MLAARPFAVMLMSAMLTALAGCATTHGRLSSSADRLEHDSDAMASDARNASSDYAASDYTRDARELADRADAFRRTVNDSRADDRDIDDAFDRLSRSYHTLREDVDRSDSPEARADLRPVTQDYLDLEGQMQGHPAHDRYAEAPARSYPY